MLHNSAKRNFKGYVQRYNKKFQKQNNSFVD